MAIFRGTGSASATADQTTIDTVTQAVADAEAAQTAAETAQGLAETAKTNAENLYGDLAAVSTAKTDAETAATTATTKASEASDDAADAQKLALNPVDSEFTLSDGSTTGYSALHYNTQTQLRYDNFDDRYLGSKAVEPSVDNDGDPLITGAMYFDTTDNLMYVWTGTGWVNVTPSSTVTISQVTDVTSNATELNVLDVSAQTPTDGQVLTYDTTNGLNWETPSTENNDLTASVTWANVPDANITQSSVTQHQAALSVAHTQVTGLGTAATTASTDYATAAQGTLADSALQSTDIANMLETTDIDVANGVQSYNADNAVLDDDQTFTGDITFTGTSKVQQTKEKMTISATAATGTINYDALTQSVLYYTTNASANWTVNVRGDGSNTLNSMMSTGEALTVVFLVTQGSTAYYNSAFQVDGSSVTPKWQGGDAPTEGTASGIDAYTYNIIKTADATFTVLASVADFA